MRIARVKLRLRRRKYTANALKFNAALIISIRPDEALRTKAKSIAIRAKARSVTFLSPESDCMIESHAASTTRPENTEIDRIENNPKPTTLYRAACVTTFTGIIQ